MHFRSYSARLLISVLCSDSRIFVLASSCLVFSSFDDARQVLICKNLLLHWVFVTQQ